MKIKLIIYTLLILGLISCNSKNNFAKIKHIDSISLGTIKINHEVTKIVYIKNLGNETLILKGIKASCGCTVIDKYSNNVSSNDSIPVKLKVKPNELGKFSKNIMIRSNDKKEFTTINILANVIL